jgi:hypothetical protein
VAVITNEFVAAAICAYKFNVWILEDKIILPGLPGNPGPAGYPPLPG